MLKKITELELAELQAQQYELLMQTQHNLRAIRGEIVRRKKLPAAPDACSVEYGNPLAAPVGEGNPPAAVE
jgi:hypothetical protein